MSVSNMRRREFLKGIGGGVLGMSLAGAQLSGAPEKTSNAPNILWIIAEDMSPDLGCYGNKVVTTPNIDRLAARGVKFNSVFTTAPACSPSRTALGTGVYQTTLGAYHMRYSKALMPVLSKPVKVLPELMRENGYYTGNIKKIGGTGTGKDDWQFKAPGKSWDTSSWSELVKHQPFYAQINSKQSHRKFASSKGISKERIEIPPYYPDHPVTRNDWAGYFASVNQFDRQVGAILKRLEADHLDKNTIVCVFSDHGRPMIRGKNWLYDSGTRIPLIIYYPENVKKPDGHQVGKENSALLSVIDLVAETVLMAGGAIPDWMQGRSFLQKDSVPRKYIHTAVDRIGNIDSCSRAVRTDRFKYIRNFKTPGSINECTTAYRRANHPIYHLLNIMGGKNLLTSVQAQLLRPLAAEELYDLKKDPYETVNLIGNKEFEAVHKELKEQLAKWIESSKDKGLAKDSDAIVEHFKAYGAKTRKLKAKSIRMMRASVEKHFK
ncbi:MAG: sulfatase [Phycisphaerae bacterium]|nr:sulfatase [Phycisphaerae bacterium]